MKSMEIDRNRLVFEVDPPRYATSLGPLALLLCRVLLGPVRRVRRAEPLQRRSVVWDLESTCHTYREPLGLVRLAWERCFSGSSAGS